MVEPLVIQQAREKLAKNGERPKCNLPALARRDYDFMKNILADPGELMCSFDFVSLEPSVSAAWSNDPMYKYATCDGIGKRPFISSDGTLMVDDLYLMFATQLNPEARDKILKTFDTHNFWDRWLDPSEDREAMSKHKDIKAIRQFAKTAALGIERGMGAAKLQTNLLAQGFKGVTLVECKDVIEKFWIFFEGLKALSDRLHAEVKQRGYFITRPFGFKVNCEPHKAYAHFTQAQAAGVIEVLMLKFFNSVDYTTFKALIHDEIVFTIPKLKKEQCLADINLCLESLNEDLGWTVPMRLGSSIGLNFGDCK